MHSFSFRTSTPDLPRACKGSRKFGRKITDRIVKKGSAKQLFLRIIYLKKIEFTEI